MNSVARWVLILTLVEVVGCVPMTVDYFSLDAPGGRAFARGCSKTLAPSDALEFNIEGVLLIVWMHPHGKVLRFQLHVPEGQSVSLTKAEILLREPMGGDKNVPIAYFVDGRYRALNDLAGTQFKGGVSTGFFKKRNEYSFLVEFDVPLQGEFYVALPSIVTPTKVFQIPEIHFEKKRGLGIYAINC